MDSKINPATLIKIILLLSILTGSCHKKGTSYTFETSVANTGSIINTITATGTIQADTTVSVGTQVSGVIKKIYVDFNSVVKKGQLLAELDKTPLETQVQQAQAALDDAKSEVEFQTATFERFKALREKNLVAQADFDQVKYNYDKAQANLKTAQAGYDKARVNLNYASILSPISGVVLNRAVDQGQTVAASFNTPTLFTIGNDLSQTQVQANVDEADIGLVKKDQQVDFTVDAYPSETFRGTVRQIRLQPIVTSNVVTYTVIVNAPNPDLKLMPGMTANITVLVEEVDSVLIIPGKALRFTPDPAYMAENMKNAGASEKKDSARYKGTGQNRKMPENSPFKTSLRNVNKPVAVWMKTGDSISRVNVVTGAADGTNTEIKSGLSEGDEVILSMIQTGKKATTAGTGARSPFMPQRRPAGNTRRPG